MVDSRSLIGRDVALVKLRWASVGTARQSTTVRGTDACRRREQHGISCGASGA